MIPFLDSGRCLGVRALKAFSTAVSVKPTERRMTSTFRKQCKQRTRQLTVKAKYVSPSWVSSWAWTFACTVAYTVDVDVRILCVCVYIYIHIYSVSVCFSFFPCDLNKLE